jgi:hypothetical protein
MNTAMMNHTCANMYLASCSHLHIEKDSHKNNDAGGGIWMHCSRGVDPNYPTPMKTNTTLSKAPFKRHNQ